MKWLITGAGGMVGTDLREALAMRGEDVVALTKSDLDITDSRAVNAALADTRPSVVINLLPQDGYAWPALSVK